jgi:uncharacterized repeat protein (TIGR02543 family)
VDGVELFRDQFYFAAEGAETPAFIGTPVRDGYTFAGWKPVVDQTVSGDVVYEATWTANTYTVTFDVSGGQMDEKSMEFTFDQPMTQLPVPVRPGYTFAGWIDRMGNVYTNETIYQVADDLFLIAMWNVNTYTITLDANGGELSILGVAVEFDTLVGELPVPVREGFTFLGWFDAEGNEYTAETVYTVDGDVTLTAKWAENTPPTGDNSHIGFAMILATMSILGVAVLTIKRKEII